MKILIKKSLDAILDRCTRLNMLPQYMTKLAVTKMPLVEFDDEDNSAKDQKRCKKFEKMLPTVQLVFC